MGLRLRTIGGEGNGEDDGDMFAYFGAGSGAQVGQKLHCETEWTKTHEHDQHDEQSAEIATVSVAAAVSAATAASAAWRGAPITEKHTSIHTQDKHETKEAFSFQPLLRSV